MLGACDDQPSAAVPRESRVVSLSPNTTEAMYAIGAESQLVGRSQQCDHPPAVTKLPSVGSYASPNVEAVLALRPTLVIGARGPSGPTLQERLAAHGIATYFPAVDDIAGIRASIVELGVKTGHVDHAEKTVSQIARDCDAVEAWAKERGTRPRVLLVFDVRPIFVAGPGAFPDELIRRAGGINVVSKGGGYPSLGLERILVLDPDVIIDASMASGRSRSMLSQQPGWSAVRAVREGNVRILDGSTALRPGPRIARGLRAVARAIHGVAPPEAP